ncbi:MAG: hypothetical protein IT204_09655 [Fimbriimonadaceae bacterium]|nr:hypothetical protein [Fimbriimonadaceae bacterium]
MIRAGLAAVDITPPLGSLIIGWLVEKRATQIADPLHARVLVIEAEGGPLAFVQLDHLSVRWTTAETIRQRVQAAYGFPAARVLVGATHTHAGPAVAKTGLVPRDDEYVAWFLDRLLPTFGAALADLRPAEIGFGSGFECTVARNRRVLQRDGTVRTHGRFDHPNALAVEGPIDPEVAVLAVREPAGALRGVLVNYACHPTHHGSDGVVSAGWPGQLAAALQAAGCPHCLFFNGAAGNLHFSNPDPRTPALAMPAIGAQLAGVVQEVLAGLEWQTSLPTAAARARVELPYREPTPAEIAGTVRGAQRFVDPRAYDDGMPELLARIRDRGTQPAEVQLLRLGPVDFLSIPAEYFVELGLAIKQQCHPRRAVVLGYANGMVGYVAPREAYARGGYECTFISSSRVGPGAGELLAAAAVELSQTT